MLYYAAVWNRDGELVRHYVPARRVSDGAVGLYETVAGQFLGNASGNGAFLAGPEIGQDPPEPTLPSGYLERAYLWIPAGPWIDTGYTPNDTDAIEMKLEFYDNSGKNQALFCARDDNYLKSLTAFFMGAENPTRIRFDRYECNDAYSSTLAYNKTYTVKMDAGTLKCYVNGTDQGCTPRSDSFTPGSRLTLFASHLAMGSSTYNNFFYGRFYNGRIWNASGDLLRDYRPAQQLSNSAIGLYDLKTGTFLGNSGSGTISAGPAPDFSEDVVVRMPEGIVQHTYLQANGDALNGSAYMSGQCIDSGYTPSGTDIIEMRIRPTDISTTQNLCCGRDGSGARNFTCWILGGKLRFDRNGDQVTGPSLQTHEKYVVRMDAGNRKAYLNGADLNLSFPSSTYTPGGRWTFFASQRGNDAASLNNYGSYALYHVRVWNASGVLVRCYVPAHRVVDGDTVEIGLYETETKTFLTNQGTGTFSIGDEIAPPEGDLVAHWPFGAAKLRDTSGYGNTLTAGSTAVLGDDGTVTLDGTANSLLRTKDALRLSDLDAITAQCWFKFDAEPTAAKMILETSPDYNVNNGALSIVYTTPSHQLETSVRTGQGSSDYAICKSSTGLFSSDRTAWHHVAYVVKKGADVQLYIDGKNDTQAYGSLSKKMPATCPFRNDNLYLGSRGGVKTFLDGKLADVRLYGSAKSANAVKGDYVRGLADRLATKYYLCAGGDTVGQSALSGTGSSIGWSTTRGGSRNLAGMTVANANYVVTPTSGWVRTPDGASGWTSPATATLTVEEGVTFSVALKVANNTTVTLNNTVLQKNATLTFSTSSDGCTTTVAGFWACAEGSRVCIPCVANGATDIRQIILGATLCGTGSVEAYPDNANAAAGNRTNKITGDLSEYTGSIMSYGAQYGGSKFTLEIVNAQSLPKDDPLDPARVVVTNEATLRVDVDWDSGASRTWDFGDAGVPTVYVADGKVVTVRGDVEGTVGLKKTGSGMLLFKYGNGAKREYNGDVVITAKDLADYRSECVADVQFVVADIPTQYYEGTPCDPDPEVTRIGTGEPLVRDVDYAITYTNNDTDGTAVATVRGIGDGLLGSVVRKEFRVVDIAGATLPPGVTLLDYVQFSGSQYINTGIVPVNHQIDMRYYVPVWKNGSNVFGCEKRDGKYPHWSEWCKSGLAAEGLYYWAGDSGISEINSKALGVYWSSAIHELTYNSTNDHQVVFDGQLFDQGKNITEPTYNLIIGYRNNGATFAGYMYRFRMTDRATGYVVLDLLPAKAPDGKVCMVDAAHGGYYYASGSGTLTAGPNPYVPDIPSDLPVSGAALHVDGSRTSTMLLEEKGGRKYVKRWNNASGGTRYAYSGYNASIGAPYLGTRDGMTFVDYGPGSASGLGGAHAWSAEDGSIREVFMVFSDYPGTQNSGFLLGDYNNNYRFHRGGTRGALFHYQYADSVIRGGLVQIDGVTVNYDMPLAPGFHVIHVRTTGNTRASRFASDRDTNGNGWGGELIAEAIVYDKVLTDDEAAQTTAYLQNKWAKLLWRPVRRGKGVPGLRWKMFGSNGDTSDWQPTASDPLVPGALLASCAGSSYNDGTYSQTMGEYHTWSYKGAVYMTAGKRWCFAGSYDDCSYVFITPPNGQRIQAQGNNNRTTFVPTETGWHTIDVRVGNHNGGVGPSGAPYNSASQLGAGVAWNTNGVTDCTTGTYASWRKFMNKADDVFLYTDEPSVTLYGTNCHWTGAGGDRCWSNALNWAEGRVPDTNGWDTAVFETDATVDFSGAALYEIIHRGGELTVTTSDGRLVLSEGLTSSGTRVNWGAETFFPGGTHVFSNGCPFVCTDGFRLRGYGANLTKTGPGDWTVAEGAQGSYEMEGTFRIEEGTVHTFTDGEQVWMPWWRVYGPTAQLSYDYKVSNNFNRNAYLYLGESKKGGRIRIAETNALAIFRLYLLGTQCKGGTWKPYPWGMESTSYQCWPDLYGADAAIAVRGNDSNITLFTPLGKARDTGRTRTWTGAAYDDDPDNPANWKEGVPAWYCDNVIIEADGAPASIRTMEFHDLRLYYDWATTNLTVWGALHLSDGFLRPAYPDVVYTLGGDWMHTIDGRRYLMLENGSTLCCTRGLTLAGAGGLRFPTDGDCVPQPIFGDLILTGGGRLEAEAGCGLAGAALPGVTNVVITGFGSCVSSSHRALFNDDVVLSVSGGARHKLGSGINQNVLWFITAGRKRPGRVYTGSGPNGVKLPDYLSGEGTVTPRRGGMGLVILGHGR